MSTHPSAGTPPTTAADADSSGQTASDSGLQRLRTIVKVTAMVGGPLFLISVILHPARDGHDIAANYNWYETTHAVEAMSLLVQAACLAGVLALGVRRFGPRGLPALYTALIGTMSWAALIVYDGSHNPVTAKYAPGIVHTSEDLDLSGTVIVLAANILFPLGYVLLARLVSRHGARSTGLLLGAGAVLYSLGGTAALLGLGPHSMTTSVLEIAGAIPYAIGYVMLGRSFGRPESEDDLRVAQVGSL